MHKDQKKKLSQEYREREAVGAVYAVRNTANGRILLDASMDISGIRNRFNFTQKQNNPMSLKLQKDWEAQGPDSFVFEVLEELEKRPDQTPEEFRADMQVLKDLWREKLGDALFY